MIRRLTWTPYKFIHFETPSHWLRQISQRAAVDSRVARRRDFDDPSALCSKLARRELDIALASSFEFLRNPVYGIVDDVSISSAGPVYSVVVAHTGDISEIGEIELDPASETSANLLQCLLAELNFAPLFQPHVAHLLSLRTARGY